MMLIGLNDMESTFDDRPLGKIILLRIGCHLVHWGIIIHAWSGIARLLFDFLLILGPSMSYW